MTWHSSTPRRATATSLTALLALAAAAAPACTITVDPSEDPALELAAPLVWGTCPPAADPNGPRDPRQQCATLDVPLDERTGRGETITLAISRIPAAVPGLRRGVLLLNPGGPGGSGLDLPSTLMNGLAPPLPGLPATPGLPQDVLDRYDLIGFDPRFVGHSTPLDCDLTAAERGPQAPPDRFDETAAVARDIAARCAVRGGARLPFLTTLNTARDVDRIRRALGETTISYLGYSYGTYLGAVYSSLFPARVDRFILDSAVDPDGVWRGATRVFGAAGELRFGDFARFAAAQDELYQFGATADAVHAFVLDLVDRLDRAPFTLPNATMFSGEGLRTWLYNALYSRDDLFPVLAEIVQFARTAADDPAQLTADELALLEQIVQPSDDNQLSVGLSVFANDTAWPTSPEQYRRELALDSVAAPLFAPIGSSIWPAAFWPPIRREPLAELLRFGPTKILIVQNLRDPSTPYQGALGMRAALGDRARLVSVDGGGHGVYPFKENPCANATTTAFLVTGTLPTNDLSCPAPPSTAPSTAHSAVPSAVPSAVIELSRVQARYRAGHTSPVAKAPVMSIAAGPAVAATSAR